MNGLPQGLMYPPRPLSEKDNENLVAHGKLGPTPGTMVLVFIFLAAFALYFFTNFKMLSFVWKIG
ncbi:MAG TPA: hypothetical protein VF212_04190 [Longimicrobiales bacterium]